LGKRACRAAQARDVTLTRARRESARRLGVRLPLRTGVTMADTAGGEGDNDPMIWVRAPPVGDSGALLNEHAALVDGEGALDGRVPDEVLNDGVPEVPDEVLDNEVLNPPRRTVTVEEIEDEGDNLGVGDDECGAPFIEEFDDPRAGQPINESRAERFDLRAHMASVGRFASPKDFEVAELLMTTKMTNESRDEHLKSRKVSSLLGRRLAQLLMYLLHSTRGRLHGHMSVP
jgi:hypothetical protein